MNRQQDEVERIFEEAAEIECPERRAAYLDEACGVDLALRRELNELLQHDLAASGFLEQPAVASRSINATNLASIGESPGTVMGPYLLKEQIGEGTFGLVYLAQQQRPVRREVAIKIIKPGMDTKEVIGRFEAERQALALMNHPNISKVFDAGSTEAGRPYFVMELVDGLPITQYCDQQRLPIRERLKLFLEVCRATHHAHQKGIIHRDLKPTNVLVSTTEDSIVPKVIDFGVAKAVDQKLSAETIHTRFHQPIGTPLYMSPEQAELGLDVDTRSDVYSLGVLLYELLTGEVPFDRELVKSADFDTIRWIIRHEQPRRPSSRVSTLDAHDLATVADCRRADARQLKSLLRGELDWLVMKALEKDRDRRYESVAALAGDIERLLANQPIQAGPPSASYRIKKFIQRNKARLIPAAVVATLLMAGATLSVRAVLIERTEKEKAWRETARHLYVSRMAQAVAAWEANDFGSLAGHLNKTVPTGELPDFRGWEWHLLNRQYHRPFAVLPDKPVWQAVWHPRTDEIAVVTANDEQVSVIEVWMPDEPLPVRKIVDLPETPADTVSGLRWAAGGDRLALATSQGRAVVLETATGEILFDQQTHAGPGKHRDILGFDLSTSGEMLATSSNFGEIKTWDVRTNRLIDVLLESSPKALNISSIAFSPKGDRLAAALRFGQRVTWDLTAPDPPDSKFDYEPVAFGSKGSIEWCASENQFAATDTNIVAVYRRDHAASLIQFPHRGARSVCWIGDRLLVSSGMDQAVRVWDIQEKREKRSMRIGRVPVPHMGVSYNGEYLATVGRKMILRVIRLTHQSKYEVLGHAQREEGSKNIIRWSHDGQRIAAAQITGTRKPFTSIVRVYDVSARSVVAEHEIGLNPTVEWARDDATVLAIDNKLGFYELGVADPSFRKGPYGYQYRHRFDPELPENKSTERGQPDFVGVAARMPGWFAYANAANLDELQIYDLESRQIKETIPLHDGGAKALYAISLAVSPDQKYLAAACSQEGGTYMLTYEPQRRQKLGTPKVIEVYVIRGSLVWNPTSTALAAGTNDGSILVMDATSFEQRAALVGHTAPPQGIAWSPNGRRIASCANDGTVRIWDASIGDELAVFHLPGEPNLYSVEWSPDGRQLAAGDVDGVVYVLDGGDMAP